MPIKKRRTLLEVHDVTYRYDHSENVLENVSLTLYQGDYLGIIGPNGGGKTTLLKLILGLLPIQSGTISLETKKIGYIPQKVGTFDHRFPITVGEVVAMGLIGQKGIGHGTSLVDNVLAQVAMEDYKDRLIGNLSGGQLQRIFIARALVATPEIIFLDEPTAGVDTKTQDTFYALLKKLNKDMGITLVLVSHDIDIVASETTEIACINKTLVYDENPKAFLKQRKIQEQYGKGVNFIIHHH